MVVSKSCFHVTFVNIMFHITKILWSLYILNENEVFTFHFNIDAVFQVLKISIHLKWEIES